MDDKKKKFIMPKAEVVDFSNEDIITESLTRNGTADWTDGNIEDYLDL